MCVRVCGGGGVCVCVCVCVEGRRGGGGGGRWANSGVRGPPKLIKRSAQARSAPAGSHWRFNSDWQGIIGPWKSAIIATAVAIAAVYTRGSRSKPHEG